MSFLFRKYRDGAADAPMPGGEREPETTSPAHPPPEFRLWPPSPKAQIVLIGGGFFLLNLILIAIWAIALYLNS